MATSTRSKVYTRPLRKATNTDSKVLTKLTKRTALGNEGLGGGLPPTLNPLWGGRGGSPPTAESPECSQPDHEVDGKNKIKQILDLTKTLTTTELRHVLNQLSLELRGRAERSSSDRTFNLWLQSSITALHSTMQGSGRGEVGSALLSGYIKDSGNFICVQEFLDAHDLTNEPVATTQAILHLLATLLARYAHAVCQRTRIPLTPKAYVNCMPHLAQVFDSHFPGYAESGLVKLVAKRVAAGDLSI